MQDPALVRLWQAGMGLALLALGAALAVGTANLPISPAYSMIGPRLFPGLIAAGLCLTGAALLAGAWRPGRDAEGGVPRLDAVPLLLASGGLIGHMLLIESAGFIVASTFLFAAIAAAFGNRRHAWNVAVGLALTLVAYFGFTRGLGLELPPGPF